MRTGSFSQCHGGDEDPPGEQVLQLPEEVQDLLPMWPGATLRTGLPGLQFPRTGKRESAQTWQGYARGGRDMFAFQCMG